MRRQLARVFTQAPCIPALRQKSPTKSTPDRQTSIIYTVPRAYQPERFQRLVNRPELIQDGDLDLERWDKELEFESPVYDSLRAVKRHLVI